MQLLKCITITYNALGKSRFMALPVFHFFTGYDVTSAFFGKRQKDIPAWNSFPDVTNAFLYLWPDLTKPGFHTHPIWRFITLSGSMALVSNFHLLLFEHGTILCENSRPIASSDVKLYLLEVQEFDVYGSLVLSNSVAYCLSSPYFDNYWQWKP